MIRVKKYPKRINKNNASQPETTVPERNTRRPLTAEEQAAVDRANAQWRADNEARYAEMEKQIENMYNVDNIVFGSPEEILDPNYVSIEERPISTNNEDDIVTHEDDNICVRYIIYNSKVLPLLRITSPSPIVELMKRGIKYLHELQNIYYCLIGNELEVKL